MSSADDTLEEHYRQGYRDALAKVNQEVKNLADAAKSLERMDIQMPQIWAVLGKVSAFIEKLEDAR